MPGDARPEVGARRSRRVSPAPCGRRSCAAGGRGPAGSSLRSRSTAVASGDDRHHERIGLQPGRRLGEGGQADRGPPRRDRHDGGGDEPRGQPDRSRRASADAAAICDFAHPQRGEGRRGRAARGASGGRAPGRRRPTWRPRGRRRPRIRAFDSYPMALRTVPSFASRDGQVVHVATRPVGCDRGADRVAGDAGTQLDENASARALDLAAPFLPPRRGDEGDAGRLLELVLLHRQVDREAADRRRGAGSGAGRSSGLPVSIDVGRIVIGVPSGNFAADLVHEQLVGLAAAGGRSARPGCRPSWPAGRRS